MGNPLPVTATAERCAWCERPLDGNAQRRAGRVLCPACGAATTDPWPSDRDLERAYAAWYRPPSGRFTGVGDRLLARTRARLAGRIERIAPLGPILDVGAGDGTLLEALHAAGRQATGLEREPARPDMRSLDLTDVQAGWAAIVFWHSLEHLRNPGVAIRQAAERLLDGGVLVISVPNAASLQARAFGDRWFALDLPRHLVHLPAEALLEGLREAQLSVTRVSYARGGQVVFGWLHGLVGALPGRPDLYDAIRRREARRRPMPPWRRAQALAAATILWPGAVMAAMVEIAARRGGTIYVEARRRG